MQCEHRWLQPATLQQLSGLTRLSLQSSFEAAKAAADFSCLPQLQELCLAAEGLQELPAGVSGLHRLRVLDLSGNSLTALPPGPYLRRLRSLSLASNRFEQLPPALAEATALEELDLTLCRLQPTELSLAVLRKVTNQGRLLGLWPCLNLAHANENNGSLTEQPWIWNRTCAPSSCMCAAAPPAHRPLPAGPALYSCPLMTCREAITRQ